MVYTSISRLQKYFNSHARVGRDAVEDETRKAGFKISTHTPAWGATQLQSFSGCFETDFNSHARVGRDGSSQNCIDTYTKHFNSHARVGRDSGGIAIPPEYKKFQLTRPRGARHEGEIPKKDVYADFNSHARVGRDLPLFYLFLWLVEISTHTPAWGATCCRQSRYRTAPFQLTRPRGARPSHPDNSATLLSAFQLTRPRGARQLPAFFCAI